MSDDKSRIDSVSDATSKIPVLNKLEVDKFLKLIKLFLSEPIIATLLIIVAILGNTYKETRAQTDFTLFIIVLTVFTILGVASAFKVALEKRYDIQKEDSRSKHKERMTKWQDKIDLVNKIYLHQESLRTHTHHGWTEYNLSKLGKLINLLRKFNFQEEKGYEARYLIFQEIDETEDEYRNLLSEINEDYKEYAIGYKKPLPIADLETSKIITHVQGLLDQLQEMDEKTTNDNIEEDSS